MKTTQKLLIVITYFFFISLSCGNNKNNNKSAYINDSNSYKITVKKAKDTITVIAVGDIMLGSAYPSSANLPPDGAINSFSAVKPHLKGDVIFGNLEGCFLNSGKSSKCHGLNPNNCFAFRMPEHYGKIIKDAGFNLLSIANNHVGDFDDKGRKKTVQILDSLKIHYAGQTNYPFVLFEKDNVKFSFCAFAPNENTLSINNIDSAKILVRYLKTISDIVIVSFHGGAEGSKHEHVPKKREIFFNENRGDVYAFSHAVIDVGADLVLGHGPHVTRAAEVYKNKFIIYSLGNFCTYGMFNLKGPNGIAPLLKIRLKTNGDFIHADVVSTKQDKINGLQLDENHTAFNCL